MYQIGTKAVMSLFQHFDQDYLNLAFKVSTILLFQIFKFVQEKNSLKKHKRQNIFFLLNFDPFHSDVRAGVNLGLSFRSERRQRGRRRRHRRRRNGEHLRSHRDLGLADRPRRSQLGFLRIEVSHMTFI